MGCVSTKEVIKELGKLKRKMGKEFDIERMFLFGSRARGEELLTSDVDVVVVSKDFRDIPFRKRALGFLEHWVLSVDLEVLCYSPEELDRKSKELGIVNEALKHSLTI